MENPFHNSDVNLGDVFLAQVSGKIVKIRIDTPHEDFRGSIRGWDGTNLDTGRKIRIKSAAKLRRRMS